MLVTIHVFCRRFFLGLGSWVLGLGSRVLGLRSCVLGLGSWVLGLGFCFLGLWVRGGKKERKEGGKLRWELKGGGEGGFFIDF